MLGAILATIYLVTLVLPGLVLALLDRWPPVSLGFGILAVAIASDAVLPWLPGPCSSPEGEAPAGHGVVNGPVHPVTSAQVLPLRPPRRRSSRPGRIP